MLKNDRRCKDQEVPDYRAKIARYIERLDSILSIVVVGEKNEKQL